MLGQSSKDMCKFFVTLLVLSLVLCTFGLIPAQVDAESVLGTSIDGKVVNETGEAFPGVEIYAVNVTNPNIFSSGLSDASGNYSLTVNPGIYNVTATYLNYTANVSYLNVTVGTGDMVILNFTMNEVLCTLIGYVTNGTQPVYGVTVTLTNLERTYTALTVTPFGQYTINAKPGIYTIKAEKIGYWANQSDYPVTLVRFAEHERVDLNITEQPAKLSGHVVYQGDGLKGVSVRLISGSISLNTVSDENGNYTFDEVPVGTYTLTFNKDTYLEISQTVTLSVYEEEVLDVEMEYDSENNTQTYLFGFDLAHSLMIVGLIISLVLLIVALFFSMKVRKKPEILKEDKDSD